MRDIRFRAWNKSNKLMGIIKSFFGCSDGDFTHATLIYKDKPKQNIGINHLEIMQFTGLTDRNGVDMYESDVAKGCLNGGVYVVKHGDWINADVDPDYGDNLCYGWYLERIPCGTCESIRDSCRTLTLIGNIHQHPHLIKGNEPCQT